MSSRQNVVIEFPVEPRAIARRPAAKTRPIYWSVRRELWEHRSVYLAPLVVAACALVGFAVEAAGLAGTVGGLAALAPADRYDAVVTPYCVSAGIVMFTGMAVGAYYCLDALAGERRDRSVLFWKSTPVSDRATVLSKALVPLAVVPALTFAIVLAVHLVMLASSVAILLASGVSVAAFWAPLRLVELEIAILFLLPAIALWHAPIYGWLLLASSWSRRAALLWAALPWLAAYAVERVAFGTSHVASLLTYRATGWMTEAFVAPAPGHAPLDELSKIDPTGFFTTPGLWLGLVFAAVCLAAAVRLRRNREPN